MQVLASIHIKYALKQLPLCRGVIKNKTY